MKPRFQADADLNEEIVAGLIRREPSVDFQTAEEASLRGLPDPEVLARAAKDNRIIVTHDRRTMPKHFADFLIQQTCPGVFIVSQRLGVREAVEELLVIWAASDAEEWTDRDSGNPTMIAPLCSVCRRLPTGKN